MENHDKALKELRTIPGVGKEISEDFYDLGIRSVADLKNKNPEVLYKRLCVKQRKRIDRCMLYVMRSAVYYASRKKHNPRLLLWWNWKDKK
jgi:nucleotidyltransferase/DNA polymerase involved in DNA repair